MVRDQRPVQERVRGSEMLELERKEEVDPVCPHCSDALKKMWFQELSGMLGKRYVYLCPHCRKVLGVSHRKGFFMG
jgi:uncharacterized protein with PIN domain